MPSQNPIHAQTYDLVTTIIGNPGLGNNLNMAVPANSRIEIIYLGFIFTTCVAAANRYPTILGTTPMLNQTMGGSTVAQVASKNYGWSFIAGLTQQVDLSAQNIMLVPMSPNLILEPGDSLESFVLNINGSDAITSIITRFKQWVIA